MRIRTLLLALVATPILLLAQAAAPTAAPARPGLKVRIHVFSGRPDPEFRIEDPAEVAQVLRLLQAHPGPDPVEGHVEVMGHRLGYRGMEIRADAGLAGFGDIQTFLVNGSRLQIHRGTSALRHRDPDAALEGYLLERGLAQGRVEPAVARHVRPTR